MFSKCVCCGREMPITFSTHTTGKYTSTQQEWRRCPSCGTMCHVVDAGGYVSIFYSTQYAPVEDGNA